MAFPVKSPAEQKIFAFLHLLYAERQRFIYPQYAKFVRDRAWEQMVAMAKFFAVTPEEAAMLEFNGGPVCCDSCGKMLGTMDGAAITTIHHMGCNLKKPSKELVWNLAHPWCTAYFLGLSVEAYTHLCVLWEQENKHLKTLS